MLRGCIDIGSNTTRLLVAGVEGGEVREVLQDREYTRLGGGGEVPPERVAAIAGAVAAQVRRARASGCASLRVVGTAALREALNRDELVAAIEREAGVTVEVLSGEAEARLAFAGATRTLPEPPTGEVGVVDVGGGSTELVVGSAEAGVTWCTSSRVGSGQLAAAYLRSDPPAQAELDRVRRHVEGAFDGLRPPQPPAAFAVGGSAGSLRRLVGDVLDPEALDRALAVVAEAPAADVARRLGLEAERVRLLPAGMLILREAGRLFGAPLRIGRGGLREGVILDSTAP